MYNPLDVAVPVRHCGQAHFITPIAPLMPGLPRGLRLIPAQGCARDALSGTQPPFAAGSCRLCACAVAAFDAVNSAGARRALESRPARSARRSPRSARPPPRRASSPPPRETLALVVSPRACARRRRRDGARRLRARGAAGHARGGCRRRDEAATLREEQAQLRVERVSATWRRPRRQLRSGRRRASGRSIGRPSAVSSWRPSEAAVAARGEAVAEREMRTLSLLRRMQRRTSGCAARSAMPPRAPNFQFPRPTRP